MIGSKQVSQFMGVTADKTICVNNRSFRILLYQAYNAFGLIGSENNGIAILDEDNKSVLVDKIGVISSAYNGNTDRQWALFNSTTKMNYEELVNLINNNPRSRTTL